MSSVFKCVSGSNTNFKALIFIRFEYDNCRPTFHGFTLYLQVSIPWGSISSHRGPDAASCVSFQCLCAAGGEPSRACCYVGQLSPPPIKTLRGISGTCHCLVRPCAPFAYRTTSSRIIGDHPQVARLYDRASLSDELKYRTWTAHEAKHQKQCSLSITGGIQECYLIPRLRRF